MSERTQVLKEDMLQAPNGFCRERAKIVTESYQKHQDNSFVMQRAFAIRDIFCKSSLYIRDNELLFSNLSTALGLRPLYPEFHVSFTELSKTGSVGEVVDKNDPFFQELHTAWQEKDSYYAIDATKDTDTRWMQKELIFNSAAEVNGHGHIVVDFERILAKGFVGLLEEVHAKLGHEHNPQKAELYKAMTITMQASIDLLHRYADLLSKLFEQEADAKRKLELEQMAIVATVLAKGTPETFYQAIQLVAFVYTFLHHEHNGYSISLGRLDKLLYPYLEKDLAQGSITEDFAFELVENLCIKIMELPIGGIKDTKTPAITIGGLNADGTYTCNTLSYMFLETVGTLQLNSPAVIVRWHESAPEQFKRHALTALQYGTGYPGLFGDKAVIKSLITEHGATAEEAHEWTEVGCAEVYVTGKSRPVDAGLVNLPVALVLAINNGNSLISGKNVGMSTKCPNEFTGIQDVLSAYRRVFNFLLEKEVVLDRNIKHVQSVMRPVPFTSPLMSSCVEKGKDLLDHGEKFNLTCVGIFSMANVVDSLVAIEFLVFQQKKLTMQEFVDALASNFEGYDWLLAELRALPRYGNNDDRADKFIAPLSEIHYEARKNIYWKFHVDVSYEAIPREVHIDLGLISPATFDGRKQGEPFADGISPGQGRDTNGLTSVLQTVLKTDQPKQITNGVVLNLKMHPNMVANTDNFDKLLVAIDTYFSQEGEQVQIICLNQESLIDAQKHPEKYPNLIVRVAGFSAYFVTLRKELQDEIIARTMY